MLTREDNELICRVEGDAPMGKMLKNYWVPALRSQRLEPGGDPVRVRLFGTNYVAWRAHNGRAAIIDEGCPHRCASMLLARNEDNCLVCIFHGWKFDIDGNTVEIPTEPAETHDALCSKIKMKTYPTIEAGSILWVYLGEGEPPKFPNFEFMNYPESRLRVKVAYLNCNYLQGLEGTIDSAHVSILHQYWIDNPRGNDDHLGDFAKTRKDLAPRYEFEAMPYGYRGCAMRDQLNDKVYARITEFVFPYFSFIPFERGTTRALIMSIPVDDEHSAQWYVHYHPTEDLGPEDISYGYQGKDPNSFYEPPGTFENRYNQDRELIKKGHWSGAASLLIEDFIVQESMGPIVDRSKENLNSADAFIGRVRRLFLNSVKGYMEGKKPFGLDPNIDYSNIRAVAATINRGENWREIPTE